VLVLACVQVLSGFKVCCNEVVELEALHVHSLLRTLLCCFADISNSRLSRRLIKELRNVDSGAPVLLISSARACMSAGTFTSE
ncbi:hypothetical protein COCON_G00187990, partial [Conger conger]